MMFEKLEIPSQLIPSDPRFGVGPSLVPVEHLKSLTDTGHELLGTSHRKSAFKNVVKSVQEGFRQYYNLPDDYEVLVGNGGATFLFDMIGLGLVEKSSIHYTCGEFSNKWYKSHAAIPWVEATEMAVDYGQGQDIKLVEGHDTLCCTLNETSTGVILTDVPDARTTDTLIAIDATSGAGQVELDILKTDLYFFSTQKIFASEGGLFVAIASPKAIKRAEKIMADKSRYIPGIMSWKQLIDNSRKNQTYNTSSIVTFYLLDKQIQLMNGLGRKKVEEMAREKADFIYRWAEEKEYLSPYVKESQYRSTSVATIDLDDRYPAGDLTKILREKKIVYDIDAYRKLGRNQFRISLFHNITLTDLKKLTQIVDFAIESAK